MKKQYEKPMMAVELYALTQSIAACDIKIGFLNGPCVLNDENATDDVKSLVVAYQFADSANCMYPITYGQINEDGTCYHFNANAYFNS